MRKRCADSTSLSLPELTVPRGKTQVKTSGVRSGCNQVARQDLRYRGPEEGRDAKRTYSIETCKAKME